MVEDLGDLPELPEEMREQYGKGGHFDYDHLRLRMIMDKITEDPDVRERWPMTARLLERLGEAVFDVVDSMDVVLSEPEATPAIDNVLVAEIEAAIIECANERNNHAGPED